MLVVPSAAYPAYLAAWSNYKSQIVPDDKYSVEVTLTASNSYSALHKAVGEDNLQYVVDLKIKGTMNSYDLMIINNKMPSLRNLDLSECQIKACSYEFRTGYCTEDDKFPDFALFEMNKLLSVKLPAVTSIGSCAFMNCYNLCSVDIPQSVNSIGQGAFYSCSSIDNLVIPAGVTTIEYGTFGNASSLKNLTIPNSIAAIHSNRDFNIGNYYLNGQPFQSTKLTSITIPEACTNLEVAALSYMYELKQAHLPKTLKTIGEYAFLCDSKLEKVNIPSSVTSIGNYAFQACNALDTVYVYTIEPTNINQETFSQTCYDNAVLMVPKTSYYNYYYNTQWSQFKNLKEFDADYEYFYVNNSYELGDGSRVQGTPDISVNAGGALIITGSDIQHADDIEIRNNGSISGSVIASGNINAKSTTMIVNVQANLWYFFCFPFDVKRSDVTAPGSHIFYTYDGAVRAQNGSGSWKKVTSDVEVLTKGTGYIFQCNKQGELKLKVNNPVFSGSNIQLSLSAYVSSNMNDASWNFVGNPYPTYYPTKEMGYTSPITVWNHNNRTYDAISPVDDDYILQPFQGFFVQKPTEVSYLNFAADYRMTYEQATSQPSSAAPRRAAKAAPSSRQVINLYISNDTQTDRTRIVFNDEASADYELECDAAKFISNEAAIQPYSLCNGVTYAINERPLGNAEVALGYTANEAGTYTISASGSDAILYDSETGISTSLADGDYCFSTQKGTYNNRFTLIQQQCVTNIDALSAAPAEGIYYNASGMAVGRSRSNLPAGTYIRRQGAKCAKVVVM